MTPDTVYMLVSSLLLVSQLLTGNQLTWQCNIASVFSRIAGPEVQGSTALMYDELRSTLAPIRNSVWWNKDVTRSNNTPKVLWKLVNRERGFLNNKLSCNIQLQAEDETVSSPIRTCNTINVTFLENVNKPKLEKNLMHSQTNNNTVCLNIHLFYWK
jgi:hypothetical protein